MLMHSFVLDALDTTGADTFSHFEVLIDEHRQMEAEGSDRPSRLKQLGSNSGHVSYALAVATCLFGLQ